MTDDRLARLVVLLAVLIGGLVAPVATPVLAQSQGGIAPVDADLAISQPSWVDNDVDVDRSGNVSVYSVRGATVQIAPQNFDADAVVDARVRPDGAELSYDERFDYYVLSTETNGTFTLSWTVREQTRVNRTIDNETVRVVTNATRRYQARVNVETQDIRHLTADSLETTRRQADNWTTLVGEWRAFAPDRSVESLAEFSITAIRTRYDWTSWLTGTWGVVILTLVSSVSGLLLLGIDRTRELISYYLLQREINRRESLDADRADLEEQLDRIDEHERTLELGDSDLHDWIEDDEWAAELSDAFGVETMGEWFPKFIEVNEPRAVLHDRVQAMALCGYSLALSWDDARGELTGRLIVPPEERGPDALRPDEISVPLHDELPSPSPGDWPYDHLPKPTGDTVDHVETALELIDWADDDALWAFEMTDAEFDRERLTTAAAGPSTVGELAQRITAGRERLGSDERYAELCLDLVEDVRRHHYNGVHEDPDHLRTRLNYLLSTSTRLADEAGLPMAQLMRDHLRSMLRRHDPTEDARETFYRSQEGRLDPTLTDD